LKSLLGGEFEVVGSVEDGRALVDQAATLHPDVIVADISMPQLNGIEAAQQIKKTDKNIKIVFLTMHRTPPMQRMPSRLALQVSS